MSCPAPFLAPSDFSSSEGYIPGRFCGTITSDLQCCLPCPTEDWLYSDGFEKSIRIGTWFNVPSLICQVFLLVTFAIWPKHISHRHYLSIGLCISLILLHLAFIIPLGTKPNVCANALTPKDMYSSLSCAWSGAFLEVGAMGISVWVLLRSLWVHLQVCWDIDILKKRAGFWAAQAIGWGLPGLFLAVSFPVSGVSYRVGPTCFPNTYKSFITWFGWLIAFGCLATAIQFTTTVFCLWIYLRDIIRGPSATSARNSSSNHSQNSTHKAPVVQSGFDADDSARGKMAWERVKKVLKSQWRSMVLCIGLSVFSIYFGAVFVSQAKTGERAASGESRDALITWAFCLITNNADISNCGGVGKAVGLNENMVVAIWPLAGLLGLLTFLLMLRGSMLQGWWRLIRYQRRHPGDDGNVYDTVDETRFSKQEKVHGYPGFVLPRETNTTKRKSYGIKLESERPGLTSPTESEYSRAPISPVSPIGTAWPMSPPPQTSTQRINDHTYHIPAGRSAPDRQIAPEMQAVPRRIRAPERQVPTGGFDSSSDEDENRVEPLHVKKQDHDMV